MINLNIVEKIFFSYFKDMSKKDILDIKLIKLGFTNSSYKVTTCNGKYVVRIANKNIDRNNEKIYLKYLKNSNYIYYDNLTGNSICKWIDGRNPTIFECNQDHLFFKICELINGFSKINLNDILGMNEFDYYKFFNADINKNFLDRYKILIEKYKNDKKVFSHNDVSPLNIIVNNNDVFIIDFEWSSLNHPYWDIANFIREINYDISQINKLNNFLTINLDILKDFLFLTTCYAMQWSLSITETSELLEYRKKTKKQLINYYNNLPK